MENIPQRIKDIINTLNAENTLSYVEKLDILSSIYKNKPTEYYKSASENKPNYNYEDIIQYATSVFGPQLKGGKRTKKTKKAKKTKKTKKSKKSKKTKKAKKNSKK